MSDRQVRGFIALTSLLLLARWRKEQDRQNFYSAADRQPKKDCSEYTDPDIVHPSEQQHRTNQQAQWALENSVTRTQNTFTFIATVAAVGALVFTALTYCATLDVVRYTQAQAREAKRQANTAEDQLRLAKIPVVIAMPEDGDAIAKFVREADVAGILRFTVRLTNYGAGVAFISRGRCGAFIGYGLPIEEDVKLHRDLLPTYPEAARMQFADTDLIFPSAIIGPAKDTFDLKCQTPGWLENQLAFPIQEAPDSKHLFEKLLRFRGLYIIAEYQVAPADEPPKTQRECFRFEPGGVGNAAFQRRSSDCGDEYGRHMP